MKLDGIRATVKELLKSHPKLYKVGQSLFIRFKDYSDRRIFLSRYPSASYIDYDDAKVRALKSAGFHSQYGQDSYLWTEIFKGKEDGFYIDIGGNDPIELSNSYFFETQGWTGIAFDPMVHAAEQWSAKRSAKFNHAAISERRETRDFVEIRSVNGWEHALSGFKEFVREEDMKLYGFKEYKVTAASLHEFVPEGVNIDVIMIDVEGAEEIVLRGIDLDKLRPAYVMVENVSEVGGSESVRQSVISRGYELIARIGVADDLFRRTGLAA